MLLIPRPPSSKRTYTLFPYTPLFRSPVCSRFSFDIDRTPFSCLYPSGPSRSANCDPALTKQPNMEVIMGNTDLRGESVPDNLIPFPTPTARLRADVPPFDPTNPNHLRAWEAIWDLAPDRKSTRLNSSH